MKSRTTTILSARQSQLLREDVHAEIERHPEWTDLCHLNGLLRAFHGELADARRSFKEALSRNRKYRDAQWSLEWVELVRGRRSQTGAEDLAHDPRLAVVRNLLQNVPPDSAGKPADASMAFALLAVFASLGDATQCERMMKALRRFDQGLVSVLEAARLARDGAPDLRRLADMGRPVLLNPCYADLYTRAARIEAMSGNDDEALRLFALAALMKGSHARFLLARAEMASRAGDADTALACCRTAVALEPEWYAPHVAIGYEHSVRGAREEALAHLETAARLQPGYADILYQYGLLLHACGRNDEACGQLQSAVRINPGYHAARAALANLLFEAARETEALPHYELLLEEGIESSLLLGRLGYAAHAAGYRNRAEELFLDAISRDRDRPDLLCLYGLFLAETGRSIEARAVWNRALDADPAEDLRGRIEQLRDETGGDEVDHD